MILGFRIRVERRRGGSKPEKFVTISEESKKESIVATDSVGKLVKSFSVESKFGLGVVSTGLEVLELLLFLKEIHKISHHGLL